jgi:FdhE protein
VTQIIQPGEIRPPAQEAPFVRSADRKQVFRRRADRLLQLAAGHPLEPFLMFMSSLASAQQDALDAIPEASADLAMSLTEHRKQGEPVYAVTDTPLDLPWHEALRSILAAIRDSAPEPTRNVIRELQEMPPEELDALARNVLVGETAMADPAKAPLLAAALQVYWTHLSTSLPLAEFGNIRSEQEHHPGRCPVCGSRPDVGIVHASGLEQGLRYLHCSMCESEWHLVRVKCSSCEATTGMSYFGVEGDDGAVKAEACSECNTYLKILYTEKDRELDPVADDLATLGLDLLVAEENFLRNGTSLFFVPGEETSSAN